MPAPGYMPPPGYGGAGQGYPLPPPARKHAWVPALITCGVLFVVVLIVGGLAALALPNYVKVKGKAKEAESKADLHSVQLALERFATDHDGNYPAYLIGGEAKCARKINFDEDTLDDTPADPFQDVTDCVPLEGVSDTLLRMGYLTEYPHNPFIRKGASLHRMQTHRSTTPTGEDPLRNGTDTGLAYGTRFGPDCTTMGNVLADPRYATWVQVITSGGSRSTESAPTWCNVQYDFWDIWATEKPFPFLPGMFFYKGSGPVEIGELDAKYYTPDNPVLPTKTDRYILAAYGDMRTKGKDILGEEQPLTGASGKQYWTYLRSMVSTDSKNIHGCPYKIAGSMDDPSIEYGNPNGIRDAIILVLTDGEGYIGDR